MKPLHNLLFSLLFLFISFTLTAQENTFSAYPNPFTDAVTFSIQNKTEKNLSLVLYNIHGSPILRVYQEVKSPTFIDTTLTLDTLPDGVYFATLIGSDTSIIKLYKTPALAIPSLNSNKLLLKPNPTSNEISILGIVPNQEVHILNINGELVSRSYLHNNSLSTANIPKGIYYLQLFLPKHELYFFMKE